MAFAPSRKRRPSSPDPRGDWTQSTYSNDSTISRLRRGSSKIMRMLSVKGSNLRGQSGLKKELKHEVSSAIAEVAVLHDLKPVDPCHLRKSSRLGNSQVVPGHGAELYRLQPIPWVEDTIRVVSNVSSYPLTTTLLDGSGETSTPSKTRVPKHPQWQENPLNVRRAQSNPNISLARRLSTALAPSTIVRRPELASRSGFAPLLIDYPYNAPSTQTSIRLVVPADPTLGSDKMKTYPTSPQDTATASSFKDSLSPLNFQPSTGQTSFYSDVASIRSIGSPHRPQCFPSAGESVATVGGFSTLPPIQEVSSLIQSLFDIQGPASIVPAVALVEKAAATKVFFETHYDGAQFNAVTPRSMRRNRMEMNMYLAGNSGEEKRLSRQFFLQGESDYLREMRAIKARKSNEMRGIALAGYDVVQVLGKGSFGLVSLVREKQRTESTPISKKDRPVYAMKVIRKSDMLRSSQEGHLRAERDFLVSCAEHSRWIVPLIASFQDIDNLYLVMEFAIGGDFLQFLLDNDSASQGISEATARWYLAEMILCVEEAHRMKWIHRDVKPDNFLISSTGHLKLADFGLAFDGHWAHTQAYYNDHRSSLLEKLGIEIEGDDEDRESPEQSAKTPGLTAAGNDGTHSRLQDRTMRKPKTAESRCVRRRMAQSVVGTSQYMAPEVVRGTPYDGRCDWWSIGIILFECLYGGTPFCREDRDMTKKAILDHARQFRFPHNPHVSYEAQDLVYRLLQERRIRICSKKYLANDFQHDARGMAVESDKTSRDYAGRHVYPNDAEDIKRHVFFGGVPWDYLHIMTPPFIPDSTKKDSTRYFDSEAEILADWTSAEGSAEKLDDADNEIFVEDEDGERRVADLRLIDGMDGDGQRQRKHKKKEKKRARCKLLRDPVVSKTVMEVRKRNAFLGYTYRRPRTWNLGGVMSLAVPEPAYAACGVHG